MFEPAGHRKFVGHSCLYHELTKRPPSFLRRNLNQALDQHERDLSKLRLGSIILPVQGDEMSTNKTWRAGWNSLTKDMLEDLTRGQPPILKLDRLQLRRHDAANSNPTDGKQPAVTSDGPDWLPSAHLDFRVPCIVKAVFLDTSTNSTNPQVIHSDTMSGTIESNGADDEEQEFEIHLKEPFLIPVKKLTAVVETGTVGSNKWKRSVPIKYDLRLEIKCQDVEDTADFLGKLESRDPSHYFTRQGKEGTIRTVWSRFPECPPPKKLLPLTRIQGHKRLELKYGVALSIGWNRKRKSPLTIYDSVWRQINAAQSQVPTPSASDASETVTKTYSITYVFQECREYTEKSLRCPLCTQSSQKAYEHASFDRLHLHFLTHHSHFRFGVDDAPKDGVSTRIRRTVHLSLVDSQSERSGSLSPGVEEQWIAPPGPFDGAAYVRGEDSWTGHSHSNANGKIVSKRGRQSKLSSPEKQRPKLSQPVAMTASAGAVADLPVLSKNKLKVPSVPGIRFYRTSSKRPFDSDESVVESDNEVDESWLEDRLRDDRASLNLSPAAQEFLDDYNAYVEFERFPADVLVKSCLVRFARTFKVKLSRFGWRNEFEQKLFFFLSHGIIDEETVKYCLDPHFTPGAGAEEIPEQEQSFGVFPMVKHTSQNRSNTAASTQAMKPLPVAGTNICSCGLTVTHSRGSIVCDNHVSLVFALAVSI